MSILGHNQEKLYYNLERFQAPIQNQINIICFDITFQGTISQINIDCQNLISFIDKIENVILYSIIFHDKEIINLIIFLNTIYFLELKLSFRNKN